MADRIRYKAFTRNTLLEELQSILNEYPDNEQIIKELLQNAEDAGAHTVKMAFIKGPPHSSPDKGTSPSLPDPYCHYLQVPALCFYNDGMFTDEDWDGITMVRKSVKKENPLKVGKFGLGFKSVFHITDYICVVSGNTILFIDPLKEKENPNNVCQFIDLMEVDEVTGVQDSLRRLYNIFGMNENAIKKTGLNGTLFWFPLRSVKSDLSRNAYTEEKCLDLFRSFKNEASIELLFCKNLERIEVYKDNASANTRTLDFEFSVGLIDDSSDDASIFSIRSSREKFQSSLDKMEEALQKNKSSVCESKPLVMSYVLQVEICSATDEKTTTEWLVTHYFHAGNVDKTMLELIGDPRSKYRPYMGLAAPVNETLRKGEIFCLLPLPSQTESQTGLPVHVNGFFALDSNRNHLKWATHEQERSHSHKDNDIVWNEVILKTVFPEVYLQFLSEIKKISLSKGMPGDWLRFFYRTIPLSSSVKAYWKVIVDPTLRYVIGDSLPCLQTYRWLKTKDSVFSRFPGDTDENVKNIICDLYRKCGVSVIFFGEDDLIYQELLMVDQRLPSTSPKGLRDFLKTIGKYKTCCKREDKLLLLPYIVQDGKLTEAIGLELIPMSDGTFKIFAHRKRKGPELFLCENGEENILMNLNDTEVLDVRLPAAVQEALSKLKKTCSFQFDAMTKDKFVEQLTRVIDENLPADHLISLEKHNLGSQWLTALWAYFRTRFSSSLEKMENLFIVPTAIPGKKNEIKLCRLTDRLVSFTTNIAPSSLRF